MIEDGETVELNLTFDAKKENKIDKNKISYSLDDNKVCNYQKQTYNKCILVGVGEGTTTLRIYYDDKEIQTINIPNGSRLDCSYLLLLQLKVFIQVLMLKKVEVVMYFQ